MSRIACCVRDAAFRLASANLGDLSRRGRRSEPMRYVVVLLRHRHDARARRSTICRSFEINSATRAGRLRTYYARAESGAELVAKTSTIPVADSTTVASARGRPAALQRAVE